VEKGVRMIVKPTRDRSQRKDAAAGLSQEPGTVSRAPETGSARRRRRLAIFAALALAAAAAGISGYVISGHPATTGAELRVSGIPASISDSMVSLMNLDTLPHKAAPGFAFTDQAGRSMTLSDFRGKIVVLEFLDPHCTDICPIVSREFLDAYRDLGPLAGRVVFAGINVNPYHTRVQDVLAFSREQQLTTIPDWHYLTGPVPRLRPVWDAYHIYVQAPNPSADVVHTSAVYFIDPQGRERYLASPEVDHAESGASYLPADQITTWGRAIAALARSLARLSRRALAPRKCSPAKVPAHGAACPEGQPAPLSRHPGGTASASPGRARAAGLSLPGLAGHCANGFELSRVMAAARSCRWWTAIQRPRARRPRRPGCSADPRPV
jgi:cytochrome oxidase Cu insertion factor (SCO1/SenC/PrrC family)